MSLGASEGASPGLEHDDIVKLPDGPAPVCVTCIDCGPGHAQQQLVEDLEDFLAHHRPERAVVRWINVDGLSLVRVIHALTHVRAAPIGGRGHVPRRNGGDPRLR